MNEKELLNLFLDTFPDSTHPKDRGRFISYAIAFTLNLNTFMICTLLNIFLELYPAADPIDSIAFSEPGYALKRIGLTNV